LRVLVLDGNNNPSCSPYREDLEGVLDSLAKTGHEVNIMRLAEKNVHGCTGCFSCWLKTPGECVFKDDGVDYLRAMVHSDLVLFVSPLVMGFPTALLKNAIDRFIPMVLPFIETADGECRHPLRYDRNPLFALLYEPEQDTDEEDVEIVSTVFERFARNAHTKFLFAMPLSSDPREVNHAIENI
jgi:multimeric flavodoxin WrbA